MENNSRITYIEPKDKFKKINMDIILKFEPIVVGIYCKLVTLSSGKSLSINFLSKRLKISKERMRSTIVFLEAEGYITRKAIRDELGHMSGWSYCLYAEPVDEDERTRAGMKDNKPTEPRVTEIPCYGISDNTENPKHNNNIDNYNINRIDKDINIDKKSTNVDKKEGADLVFETYMKEHYPYLMKMDKPLTRQQAKQLKDDFGEEIVLEVFSDMDNHKPLLKKYRDAYKTARNWCSRRMPERKEVKDD